MDFECFAESIDSCQPDSGRIYTKRYRNIYRQVFVTTSNVLMIQFSNPGWLFARNEERISHEHLRNVLNEKSSISMTSLNIRRV